MRDGRIGRGGDSGSGSSSSFNPSIPRSPILHAQTDLLVEAIAPIIAAEDARSFDESLLRRSTLSPDSLVRRIAALSAGRLGDLRAIPLLLPSWWIRIPSLNPTRAFALGLLADSSVSDDLIKRLEDPELVPPAAALEMVTALAKTGGAEAGRWFRSLLAGSTSDGPGRSQRSCPARRHRGMAPREERSG